MRPLMLPALPCRALRLYAARVTHDVRMRSMLRAHSRRYVIYARLSRHAHAARRPAPPFCCVDVTRLLRCRLMSYAAIAAITPPLDVDIFIAAVPSALPLSAFVTRVQQMPMLAV